jgi:hypothetical protein
MIFAMRSGEVLSCGFACFFAPRVFAGAAFAGRFFAVVFFAGIVRSLLKIAAVETGGTASKQQILRLRSCGASLRMTHRGDQPRRSSMASGVMRMQV